MVNIHFSSFGFIAILFMGLLILILDETHPQSVLKYKSHLLIESAKLIMVKKFLRPRYSIHFGWSLIFNFISHI